jgi:hypothetical protein
VKVPPFQLSEFTNHVRARALVEAYELEEENNRYEDGDGYGGSSSFYDNDDDY